MEPPERIEPQGLADYLDVMSKSVMQAGISWRVVNAKWPGLRDAFRGFDPATVANLTESELDDLTSDQRVIRNRPLISRQSFPGWARSLCRRLTRVHTSTCRLRCRMRPSAR